MAQDLFHGQFQTLGGNMDGSIDMVDVTTAMEGEYWLWLNGNAIGEFNIYIEQVWKEKLNSYSIRIQKNENE